MAVCVDPTDQYETLSDLDIVVSCNGHQLQSFSGKIHVHMSNVQKNNFDVFSLYEVPIVLMKLTIEKWKQDFVYAFVRFTANCPWNALLTRESNHDLNFMTNGGTMYLISIVNKLSRLNRAYPASKWSKWWLRVFVECEPRKIHPLKPRDVSG